MTMNEKKHELMKAMNTICEALNDEELQVPFLEWGVADAIHDGPEDNVLLEDFESIATTFAKVIREATNDGFKHYLTYRED